MKKILICGEGSYIGTAFEKYLKDFDAYTVDTVDMIGDGWRKKDFSGYDVIFHVAGIAHQDTGKANDDVKNKYYKINTNLTVETCMKAKKEGVGHFVFMSSMIVFGSKNACITKDTKENPDNFYGDSKLKADIAIHKLGDDKFRVASIRPPMIYGRGSKGNYPILSKFAKKMPLFADFDNRRSMLYIENLCEFVRRVIDDCGSGYFYPQNKEFVRTADLVCEIADVCGKKVYLTKMFNPFIRLLGRMNIIKKVFGSLYYEQSMSNYDGFSYCVCDFKESVKRTEKG